MSCPHTNAAYLKEVDQRGSNLIDSRFAASRGAHIVVVQRFWQRNQVLESKLEQVSCTRDRPVVVRARDP